MQFHNYGPLRATQVVAFLSFEYGNCTRRRGRAVRAFLKSETLPEATTTACCTLLLRPGDYNVTNYI